MKASTTTSSKIRLIVFILLLVATVAVNAVTVSIIVRHYTDDNSAEHSSTNENSGDKVPTISENAIYPVFGTPEKIIIHGDGKTLTIAKDDEEFNEILEMNEHRTMFIKEYTKTGLFDEKNIDAYYMEFVYDEPLKLSLYGVDEYEASSIIFVLTGVNHGKIKFEAGGQFHAIEKLAVDPELIVKIVELLA